MSKIVEAVNVMILNPEKITNVIKRESEYYFIYKDKYKWSINGLPSGSYTLVYYASDISLDELANFEQENWEHFNDMVIYRCSDIGTKEATQTFRDLYSILNEKVFGVDEVLSDIIKDDIPF